MSTLECAANCGAVMQLARVRGVSDLVAARLVFDELGWAEGPSGEWFARWPQYTDKPERQAYQMARAIVETAEALGAPMRVERLYESAA